MDDFDGILEDLDAGGEPEGEPDPTYRATIVVRTGRVSVTGWAGWLARGGAFGQLLRERERAGVAIADLTGAGAGELIARFYADGGDLEAAEAALVEWASHVGYHRVWLSNRVAELEPSGEQIGCAEVRCPTCRAGWSDATPEFWLIVREQNEFPRWCPICGFELPQWSVREGKSAPRRRQAHRGGRRRSTGWTESGHRANGRSAKS